MFTAKTYYFAPSLDEAYETLLKNKTNTILGGCGWLRMGKKRIWTAIDLTRLGLDRITETPDTCEIGGCVTLRQLETHPALQTAFGGILPASVRHIVGVQFRNMATVGGTLFLRAGFSDLLTALLALDCTVRLHAAGAVPLAQFLDMPHHRDIITGVTIRKDGRRAAYQSVRPTATDFPILAAAVSRMEDGWTVAVGARPARAIRCETAAACLAAGDPIGAGEAAAKELRFTDNQRGSADYRRALCRVLVRRAAEAIPEGGGQA